ncbi:hypothetical protein FTX61_20535 [Nitriliruptoraceae bacterium ZYF776]|nr:hypothetical protein [Profundirhabdus halotolerans]
MRTSRADRPTDRSFGRRVGSRDYGCPPWTSASVGARPSRGEPGDGTRDGGVARDRRRSTRGSAARREGVPAASPSRTDRRPR